MTISPSLLRRSRGLACAVLLASAAACASGGSRVALGPLPPEDCARLAQGIDITGRSSRTSLESFDSIFEAAQRRSPREQSNPDERLERAPAIVNGRAIANFMSTAYPPDLLFARRGGTAMMAVLVAPDGTPARVRVFRSSGIGSLDSASEFAAQQFRFSPGIFRGCPVYVFSLMPVTWSPGPPPQGAR